MSTTTARSLIRITGDDRVPFLQGLLTQDVSKLAAEKIQFAALLSPQGKILHDMFLLDQPEAILIDVLADHAPTLVKRLAMYKLRAKIVITATAAAPIGTLADPRHPGLPPRDYSTHDAPPTTHHSLVLGIPACGVDFAPDSVVALDAGYDLLHAVSFSKGCYVGQEITARMHYKNIARRGFFILEQAGVPIRLALLKFEDLGEPLADGTYNTVVDNQVFIARAPAWMQPKLAQFHAGREKQ